MPKADARTVTGPNPTVLGNALSGATTRVRRWPGNYLRRDSARIKRGEPGPGVFVDDETLRLWDDQFPIAVVSRCAVADLFDARTKSDGRDGTIALRGIIEDFRTRPQPGVIHANRGWYSHPFEGYTNDQISMWRSAVCSGLPATTQGMAGSSHM